MVDSPDLKPTSEAETATRRELTIRHRKILSSEWTSPQIQSKLPILWTAITFLASLRMNYVEDEKKKSCPIFLITLYGIAYTRPAYLRVRENPNWGRTLLARRKHAIEMNIVRGKKGQQLTPLEIELFEIMDAAKQFVPFDMILKLDSIMRAAEGVPAPAKSSEVPDSLRGDLRAYQTVSEEEEKQLRVDPEEEERLRKRSEKERDEKKRDLRSKIVHYKEVAKNCMNHLADGDSVEAYERNLADTRLKTGEASLRSQRAHGPGWGKNPRKRPDVQRRRSLPGKYPLGARGCPERDKIRGNFQSHS